MPIRHDPEIERVFLDAVDLPADRRAAFVEAAFGEHDERARAVMQLIIADSDNTDGILDQTAHRLREQTPIRLGSYRIVREIGQGGMGIVYEALQTRPSRKVALKVIRAGLATARTLQRFELESDTLAALKHPGVVQVHEAGTAKAEYADGSHTQRPFIAMEYIDGRDIVTHAKTLALPDRLRLMADVCDAVHHAHLHGIVHRDLKPANILVDSAGHPRVLDFGVAKLAVEGDVAGTAASIMTFDGPVLGTPRYLSPEHALADVRGADVRSDVYSLGVVLGELIEAPTETAASKSARRERTAAADQDLRVIVQTATNTDLLRRYQSAASLGADLRRCAAGEPIAARGDGAVYRLRRLIKDNLLAVTLAGVALVAVVVAMIVSIAAAIRATELAQRETAALRETAIARAESDAMVAFLTSMLNAPDPAVLGRNVRVLDLLDQAAAKIDDSLTDQPLINARQHHVLGQTYWSLGEFSKAQTQFERAHDLRSATLGPEHSLTLESAAFLGSVLTTLGDHDAAAVMLERVHGVRSRTLGQENELTIGSAGDLAAVYAQLGRFAEAKAMFAAGLAAAERAGLPESLTIVDFRGKYAILLAQTGEAAAADRMYKSVLPAEVRLIGADRAALRGSRSGAAMTAKRLGRTTEAEELLTDVLARRERLLGPDHSETLGAAHNLALLYSEQGRHDEAEAALQRIAAGVERTLGPDHRNTLKAKMSLGLARLLAGRFDEARPVLLSALSRQQEVLGERHGDVADAHRIVGALLASTGDEAGACEHFAKAIETFTEILGTEYPLAAIVRSDRGAVLIRLGRFAEAEQELKAAFRVLESSPGGGAHARTALMRLRECYRLSNRADEADALTPRIDAYEQPG